MLYGKSYRASIWIFYFSLGHQICQQRKFCEVRSAIKISLFQITFLLWFVVYFRTSRSQLLFKISVLKNFANLTGKHLCWSLFLLKLQKTLTHTFSCKICELFKNTSDGCFWYLCSSFTLICIIDQLRTRLLLKKVLKSLWARTVFTKKIEFLSNSHCVKSEKYPYSEFFWSVFSHIRIPEYSVQMQEITPYLSLFSPNAGKHGPKKLRNRTSAGGGGAVPVNLLHLFRTPFFKNTSGWLLQHFSCVSCRLT